MKTPNNKPKWQSYVFFALALVVSTNVLSAPNAAAKQQGKVCDKSAFGSKKIFQCESFTSLPELPPNNTGTSQSTGTVPQGAEHFPQTWPQLGFDQRHNPVFSVSAAAPAYLTNGTFWTAPLTGLDFLDVGRAYAAVDDSEEWGSTTAQYLGNVIGTSVARGIVYVQVGRREIWALSAETGATIWHNKVTSAAGMGQSVVEEVNGRLMLFAPVGDAAFTVQNAVDFSNGKQHFRGGNFGGIYAYDGVSGEQLWRFGTQGSARPTPIIRDGKVYVNTNNNKFFVLDAASGTELGSFTNPGNGYSGLAAANWFETSGGQKLVIYGTIRPARIFGVDVTNPAAPALAWSYTPPGAIANAPGDTSVAVDPDLGIAYTTVFTNRGTAAAPIFDLNLIALDAATGTAVWTQFMGEGDKPPGYKGSIPMIHAGVVYAGDTLNGTFQAYDAATGSRLWSTDLAGANDAPGTVHRPRAAAVFYDNKVILAEGRTIHTFDPATGTEINRFQTPGVFGVWGINQPVIIGKLLIQSSISGWVFAAPVDFITSSSGLGGQPLPPGSLPSPPIFPEYFDITALPTKKETKNFPTTWLAYAHGQDHNSVEKKGPSGVSWQTGLKDAVPLNAPPIDESLYGSEVATHMMQLHVGAGTGVTPVNGIAYVGSDRFSVNAINATTGQLIWRARTQNANPSEPLVTPKTVIVSTGDAWMNLGQTGSFRAGSPSTRIGDNWANVRGFDPLTGTEKWTIYSGQGTSAMTPLYNNGNLYWVNGEGNVWAVNADTGAPIAPFMDADGLPVLSLGGFNAISSANVYHQLGNGHDIMVVGTAMPNRITVIDLTTAAILWTQDLATAGTTYVTGFATVPPAVSQAKGSHTGLIVSSVLINADTASNTVSVLAFALNPFTGAVVWTQDMGAGPIPTGFTGPTPLIDTSRVYFNNPLTSKIVSLSLSTGTIQWETPVTTPSGKLSWGPGVVADGKLIQPVGPSLYTLNAASGSVLNEYFVGGSFTYNHPTVLGPTLYIGNSWGWVTALPVSTVTGGN